MVDSGVLAEFNSVQAKMKGGVCVHCGERKRETRLKGQKGIVVDKMMFVFTPESIMHVVLGQYETNRIKIFPFFFNCYIYIFHARKTLRIYIFSFLFVKLIRSIYIKKIHGKKNLTRFHIIMFILKYK